MQRSNHPTPTGLVAALGLLLSCAGGIRAETPDAAQWHRREVDLRVSGGLRIKAVYTPARRPDVQPHSARSVGINVIDSPPLDGFVPWVTIATTDERDEALATAAIVQESMIGNPFVADPATEYAIGIFDTGAGTSLVGYANANRLGLYAADRLGSCEVEASGVTGTLVAHVSDPIGLFIDGLDAIDPETLLLDTSGMRGLSNVSVGIGKQPTGNAPDLVTAMGLPMALYQTTAFYVDTPVTRTVHGVTYTAPLIRMFTNPDDPGAPQFANIVPLQLRPEGGTSVDYWPCFEFFGCPGVDDDPQTPSVVGQFSFPVQSLFFISEESGVDLYEGTRSSLVNDGFMLDTGAQVTVIGTAIGARLALNTSNPDFLVDITGVDGTTVQKPGFYIDALDIPALGEWLSFTNVPVVLLNVASPEGGSLDGIIGMNLFTEYNLAIQGGGLLGQNSPVLSFERIQHIPIFGDADGDGDVDWGDFQAFTNCNTGPLILQMEPACLAFDGDGDGDVDQIDFGYFQRCISSDGVRADPGCNP